MIPRADLIRSGVALVISFPSMGVGYSSRCRRTATNRSFWSSVPTVIRSRSRNVGSSKYRTKIPSVLSAS